MLLARAVIGFLTPTIMFMTQKFPFYFVHFAAVAMHFPFDGSLPPRSLQSDRRGQIATYTVCNAKNGHETKHSKKNIHSLIVDDVLKQCNEKSSDNTRSDDLEIWITINREKSQQSVSLECARALVRRTTIPITSRELEIENHTFCRCAAVLAYKREKIIINDVLVSHSRLAISIFFLFRFALFSMWHRTLYCYDSRFFFQVNYKHKIESHQPSARTSQMCNLDDRFGAFFCSLALSCSEKISLIKASIKAYHHFDSDINQREEKQILLMQKPIWKNKHLDFNYT